MNENLVNIPEERPAKARAGMPVLILTSLLYLVALGLVIYGAVLMDGDAAGLGIVLLVIGILWLCVGFIPFLGLKVIKPQEALVLTLFGTYVGSLKDSGFYFVNPFCTAVNPAATTKLSQSGDAEVKTDAVAVAAAAAQAAA